MRLSLILMLRASLTGLEMTKMFAFGAASAAALARSRTIEALVLNKSIVHRLNRFHLCDSKYLTITSHARFAGDTGRNKDDFGAAEGFSKTGWSWIISLNLALGIDMADISSNTYTGLANGSTHSREFVDQPGPPRIS